MNRIAQRRSRSGSLRTLLTFLPVVLLAALLAPAAMADPSPAEQATLEDMQTIGIAMVAWQIDQLVLRRAAPKAEASPTPTHPPTKGTPSFDVTDVMIIPDGDLYDLLVPDYLSSLPTTDGWGQPYEFRLNMANLDTLPVIAIRSSGSDTSYSGTVYSPGFTAADSEDLVWMDGTFIRRPLPAAAEAANYTTEVLAQVSTAFQSWRLDQVGPTPPGLVEAGRKAELGAPAAAVASLSGCEKYMVDVTAVTPSPVSASALEDLLVPNYVLFLPLEDGWGNPLELYFDTSLALDSDWLAVRSPGSDGTYSGTTYTAGLTSADTEDLVHYDEFAIRRSLVPGQEQGETVLELQVIGGAMLEWWIDNLFGLQPGPKPIPKSTLDKKSGFDITDLETITHTMLGGLLVPSYLPCMPKVDFWGYEYDFWLDKKNLFATPLMGIRSLGSDELPEGPVYSPGTFPSAATENDILWVDGVFIRIPDPTLFFNDGFETGNTSLWDATVPPI